MEMKASFDAVPEIRRLGERGQDILQVLLPEFTLTKDLLTSLPVFVLRINAVPMGFDRSWSTGITKVSEPVGSKCFFLKGHITMPCHWQIPISMLRSCSKIF
jgi:hypothetical protein